MIYVFDCPGREHAGKRVFEHVVHHMPSVVMNCVACPQPKCGAVAKRRIDLEIPTQSLVGLTTVSNSTTTKGSLAHMTEKAFGKFLKNPDGSIDANHRPFRDTGEFNRFMQGENDLGKPKINQRTGKPLMVRSPDGSYKYVREGAKLIKFDKNDAPSRDDVRRQAPKPRNVLIAISTVGLALLS